MLPRQAVAYFINMMMINPKKLCGGRDLTGEDFTAVMNRLTPIGLV